VIFVAVANASKKVRKSLQTRPDPRYYHKRAKHIFHGGPKWEKKEVCNGGVSKGSAKLL
jgi:hypothetical protein